MKNKKNNRPTRFLLLIAFLTFAACSPTATNKDQQDKTDTTVNKTTDTVGTQIGGGDTIGQGGDPATNPAQKTNLSTVLVYNFHVTNRCVSCIAIEDATTKTLNTYFSKEMKQGRIKRYILNVDDDANSKIAEKYQAFGSGLFVTRVLGGKETTSDFTGDGFKYAKNKEEKFIEILKAKITEYLK